MSVQEGTVFLKDVLTEFEGTGKGKSGHGLKESPA